MSEKNVVKIEDAEGGSSIVFDTRYFPVCILAMIGAPTMTVANAYYDHRGEHFFKPAAARGTRVVQISDMTNAGSPPATVRKHLGERGKQEDPGINELIGYVVVVPNAVLRGVITALTWITGDATKPTVFASSIQDGVAKAAKMANDAGVDVAPITYSPPE